ncbi:hypothetical protein MMAD_34610 [Mycolicibacterium madagascariense]|uniref:DUF2561 domain-containing protein n=1 Tax=Mycolicibacterium madagascariense TaxID=212765 RepID=A0A7I7XIX9_9MYCO|nr:DUF2561 family protein [Mycolicibacterium madagascariense]MCV7015946.1 DUF2561 family protein [Mycolicibacterium madagascariense]BBZ29166.1 hypothetical protein MMAD_34610 [Mycolicibacterium madagascariense]
MIQDVEDGATRASRLRPGSPDQADRILVIAAVVSWLVALGATVAAIVALVDLGSSQPVATGGSDTPWLLYTVIAVSAAVIIGAIPLLLRARQAASSNDPGPAAADAGGRPSATAPGEARLEPFGAPVIRRHATPPASSRVGFPTAAVDQVWLRFTATVAVAMGLAMTGVGVATYLMASHDDAAAWSVYGVVAVITVAMVAAPWYFLRQLHVVLDAS